jgi:hypothetical protein
MLLYYSPRGKSRYAFCHILNKAVKKTKIGEKNMFTTYVYILVMVRNNVLFLVITLLFVITG